VSPLNYFRISDRHWLKDFESPDTHEVMLDEDLVVRLATLEHNLQLKLTIESGYRTPEHNAAVGGADHSLHMKGQAVDVSSSELELKILATAAAEAGFKTVIAYKEKQIVHCALGPQDQVIVPRDWVEDLKSALWGVRPFIYAFEDVFPS
jgi:uncharacterized protein YcbK (DUF882 family)